MRPLLQLDAVSKSYRRGPCEVRVLREVSLDVRAGEMVGVYGQRGAGKTTLLRLAAGLEPPDAGTVSLAGVSLTRGSGRRHARIRREQLGWVERVGPQRGRLPIRVHVALPLYRTHGPLQAQQRALAALAKVGAAEMADERWSSLSDTARIRVAIAHALVREPRLLLVDDPTAGLGILDRERIVGLLRAAAEEGGLAVLMAVADMPAMLHAHEVRALSRGRLLVPADRQPAARGTVVELRRGERSA